MSSNKQLDSNDIGNLASILSQIATRIVGYGDPAWKTAKTDDQMIDLSMFYSIDVKRHMEHAVSSKESIKNLVEAANAVIDEMVEIGKCYVVKHK